ncbi:MAG TPA: ABC transporter substrate-binding protein, partial [Spirochaetia bacterium]|nr:ABC transporter substrate-binding protein [Spirochaetia bacterium]
MRRHLPRCTRRFVFLFAMIMVILGCAGGEPLRIGFIAGLSGPNSHVGVGSRDAALLAVERINEGGGVGGRPLELVVADDEDSVTIGEQIVSEFVEDGIPLVIGPFMSSQILVVERHMESPILFLSPTISTSRLSGRDDNFVRIMPASTEQGRVLLRTMEEDGVRDAVVLYDGTNAAYAQELACFLHEHLLRSAIRPLDLFDVGALHERSVAESVAQLGAEAIVLVTSGYRGALIAQEISELTDGARLYGTHWTKTSDFIEYGGRAVEGAKLTSVVVTATGDDDEDSVYAEFADAYERRYGRAPEA